MNCSGGETRSGASRQANGVGVNLFVLDEPTNHFDVWACESLEPALEAIRGHGDRSEP